MAPCVIVRYASPWPLSEPESLASPLAAHAAGMASFMFALANSVSCCSFWKASTRSGMLALVRVDYSRDLLEVLADLLIGRTDKQIIEHFARVLGSQDALDELVGI